MVSAHSDQLTVLISRMARKSCALAVPWIFVIALGSSLVQCQDAVSTIPANQTAHATATQSPAIDYTSINETHLVFAIQCNPQASNCNSPPIDEIARNISIDAEDSCTSLNATINIDIDTVQLFRPANFSSIYSLSIRGNGSRITCEGIDVGISMQRIQHVKLASLILSGCSLLMPFIKSLHFRSALHIWNCSTVVIRSITIANSTGSGLNLQRNRGNVSVIDSRFINNTLTTPSSDYRVRVVGGNGVYVYISSEPKPQVYRFISCMFIENVAKSDHYSFLLSADKVPMEGRGRGGGMLITIQRYTNQSSVFVIDSRFERNQAFLGAGLSAEIEGNGNENMVSVINTIFLRNGCQIMGLGGGTHLSFEHLNNPIHAVNNNSYTIYISGVTFDSNCAELGGGVFFFSDRSRIPDSNNTIIFANSTWMNNFAHTGSAVDITPSIFTRAQIGYLPVPKFRNCKFISNTNEPTKELTSDFTKEQSPGLGTLYSSLMNLEFADYALFEDNTGSAIVSVNGIVNFTKSSALFARNYGIQGGAILLIGTAALEIGPHQKYNFTGNKASDKGGAIYSHLVDEMDFIYSRSCFIRYIINPGNPRLYPSKSWSASLIFEGNEAQQHLGHSIYATSIIPCQVVTSSNSSSRYQLISQSDLFQPPGVIIQDWNERTHHIATEGNRFDWNGSRLQVIPGEVSDLGVQILDDFGQVVASTLTAFVKNASINITSEFSCITEHTIKFSGKEGETGQLVLQTIGSRKASLTMDIELLQCPTGFKLNEKEVCMCDSKKYLGIEYCREYNAFLTPGFWVGYIQNGRILATSLCPIGFCNYNSSMQIERGVVTLPRNVSQLEEDICGERRRGILCGECREGYTTHYHSPNLNCFEAGPYSCKLGWIFYVLSELLPITILFVFVLVMNISFTTGAVNGFILFSQVLDSLQIDASGVIKFPQPVSIFSQGYKIIYGFFNLDVFATDSLSFCLWKDATALGMLSFKYLTVAYSLLLVLSLILFMRYSAARCCGSRYSISALRNSVIHGLTSFLVLCYGQCIKVSFGILSKQDLEIGGDEQAHYVSTPSLGRVLLNGNFEYFSHEHLPYALPALFVLLIIGVFPPLILLVYPLLSRAFICFKLDNSRLASCFLYPAKKLKPLLDSFQGSFKDNFRFFAGVYFFYRWVAVATYAIIPFMILFYTIVQGFLIAMLVFHSVSQPYQKRWHNILDSLLLTDLMFINGITTLNYYLTRVDVGRNEIDYRIAITGSIQLILIYLPLLYAVVYVSACLLAKVLCKGLKDNPETNNFVLKTIRKKIYRSSFLGSDTSRAPLEDSLPYRLVRDKADPFEESVKESTEEDHAIDTYI